MATKSSFKQPCPSCEAMVPIRDPKLIGRKIDCPKCKYRFVVEEPAEEVDDVEEVEDDAPKKGKSKAAGITNKKPADGKGAAKRRPDDDEDLEEAPAKKKKSGGSPMLIIGIGLAVVAVVALAVGAVFLFSGDKSDNKPSGRPAANVAPPNPGAGGDVQQQSAKAEEPKSAPKPRQEDISNLLPNDAQAVLNLPAEHLFANSKVKQALFNTPGAFHEAAFQRIWGITPADVRRVVLAGNTEKKTVFSVMRTRSALKEDQIVAGLKLKPEAPVGGLKYYVLTKPLDTFSTFLLQQAVHVMLYGSAGQYEKMALHFIDPFTVVCADAGTMNQFLKEKGQPKRLSKSPDEEAPSGDTQEGAGAPAGQTAPGRPGGPPGPSGPPGGPRPPSSAPQPPSSAPQRPGGPQPPSSAPQRPGGSQPPSSAPQRPGGGSQPPSSAPQRPGNAPPSTGRASGNYPPGAPGGMMPPGMYPGSGGSASDAAPVSSSYLTVDPHLKAVLDQVEKVDKQEGENVLVSLALSPSGVSEDQVKKILGLLGNKAPNIPEEDLKMGLGFAQGQKAAGLAITEFNDSKLDVNAALAATDAKLAKTLETAATAGELITVFLAGYGLDVIAKNAAPTNIPGMPNTPPGFPGGQPGMQPGGFPPRPSPGPGGFPGGGFPPGMQPGEEKKEEKGKDGDYLIWTKDEVLALGVHLKMNKDRSKEGREALEFAGIYLHGMTALADRRSRIHELAAALQAYLGKEGHFPPGAMPRGSDSPPSDLLSVFSWRPDQRLSWLTQLLPYLGNGEFQNLKPDPNKTWYEDLTNIKAGFTVVPQFLASSSSTIPLLPYPNINPAHGPGLWAPTHFVGIAGVGLDAAEYRNDDPATAKLRGVFGYDRQTKKEDIKDGLEQTIVAIQVPPEPKSPWIAGGGSTVRGVSDDLDCVRPFVCAKYTNKDGKEEDGTFAIMADGKVRFIPATIDPKTFQAMCTIAGDDKIRNLDAIAPEVPPPEDMQQQPELKTDVPPPPPTAPPPDVKPTEDASKSSLPAGWKEIVSKEGRYRVALPPGEIRDIPQNLKSSFGEGILHQKMVTPDKWGVYMVQYMDVAGNPVEGDLDKYRSDVLRSNPGSQVRNEKKITLAGRPGREFQIHVPEKGDLTVHVYLDKNRIYALIARWTPGKVASKDIQAFFDSFQIVAP